MEQRGSSQEIPRSLHVYFVLCPSDDRFRKIVSTTFYSQVVLLLVLSEDRWFVASYVSCELVYVAAQRSAVLYGEAGR